MENKAQHDKRDSFKPPSFKPLTFRSSTFSSPTTQNYNYLSSSSVLLKDQLPPEFRLPSLLGVDTPDFRILNTVDNEEQIPDVDFKDALKKFGVYIDSGIDDQDHILEIGQLKKSGRRTNSVNDTSNYDPESGRHVYKYKGMEIDTRRNKRRIFKRELLNEGINDEYIPNFVSFNLSKFGIDENAITDSEEEDVRISSENKSIVNDSDIVCEAKPIAIEGKKQMESDNFEVSDDSFKIAGSPEREGDRLILSSIPKHFVSLSFSNRKQLLNDLLPHSLKNDTNYKNHLTKILRKNSISFSSPNSASNIFAIPREIPKEPQPDSNEFGSLVLGKWRMGRIFNNGAFGSIRECFAVDDAQNVKAVKIIPIKRSYSTLKSFQTEFILWSKMQHKLLVSLEDIKITIDNIFLVMPLFPEGSLFDRVKYWETQKVQLADRYQHIVAYIKAIIESLKFLHDQGIHHGDIKLENYLLDQNVPKLCDFGMTNYDSDINDKNLLSSKMDSRITEELNNASLLFSSNSASSSTLALNNKAASYTSMDSDDVFEIKTALHKEHDANIGSLPYAAPELLQPCPDPVNRKTDIWAIGIVIYALIVLKLPFYHIYEPRLKLMILEGNWESSEWDALIKEDPKFSVLDKLVKSCLQSKSLRFSIDDIKSEFSTF